MIYEDMRTKIILAAAKEMRAKGIKFTMANLARRLRVSKRVIYMNFSSKNELISNIMDALLVKFQKISARILFSKVFSYTDKLKKILMLQVTIPLFYGPKIIDVKRFIPKEWEKCKRFIDKEWEKIEVFLKEGINFGILRPVRLDIAKLLVSELQMNTISRRYCRGHDISLIRSVKCIVDVLMYGIL